MTDNAFCIVQRTTEKSKTGIVRVCCVAEASPAFQAGWSGCVYTYMFIFTNVQRGE
jgi:hypothetical protein